MLQNINIHLSVRLPKLETISYYHAIFHVLNFSSVDIYSFDLKKTTNLRSGIKQVVQNPKNKAILPPKQQSDPALGKRQNQYKPEKAIEVEEVNKNMQNFNIENELCNIKIPMPFTELIKNPSYKNSVLKMIGSTSSQVPSDTVNLQEENPKIFNGSSLEEKTENDASASPPSYITSSIHD